MPYPYILWTTLSSWVCEGLPQKGWRPARPYLTVGLMADLCARLKGRVIDSYTDIVCLTEGQRYLLCPPQLIR